MQSKFRANVAVLTLISLSYGTVQGLSHEAWGAACCARTPAAPFLILGDDQAQLGLTVAAANIIAQANNSGSLIRRASDSTDMNWNYRLDSAVMLSDRWQMGLSLPWVTHRIQETGISDSTTGVGDMRLSGGFEFLPQWSYSEWKPQGFLFTVISLPTGVSGYESQLPSRADVTGNGFYSLAFGALFMKRWTDWDAFFISEAHYSLPRTFGDATLSYQVTPGWGASAGGGVGYSPGGGRLRLGLRFHPRWDTLETNSVDQFTVAGNRWTSDLGADVSYMLADTDTLILSYTDQTLLGPTQNSPLSRVVAFGYQHRWQR